MQRKNYSRTQTFRTDPSLASCLLPASQASGVLPAPTSCASCYARVGDGAKTANTTGASSACGAGSEGSDQKTPSQTRNYREVSSTKIKKRISGPVNFRVFNTYKNLAMLSLRGAEQSTPLRARTTSSAGSASSAAPLTGGRVYAPCSPVAEPEATTHVKGAEATRSLRQGTKIKARSQI